MDIWEAQHLDINDPMKEYRDYFDIPENLQYLDGNSLGVVSRGVAQRVESVIQHQWKKDLIGSWNKHQWIDAPERIGNRIAPIIGAAKDTVTVSDTLSLNVVKALSAALNMRPERTVILSDTGNFPSDLHMMQGLIRTLGKPYVLKLVKPEDIETSIDETIATVVLTHVDYRSGRIHDMPSITQKTHQAGAISVWDLAHSAGALPLDLGALCVDFAIGCTYKYLNGGPGSPGFIYVRPDLINEIWPLLSGWLGHDKPFSFDLDYIPATGIRRMRVGTPPVIAMAALDAALDVWDNVDMRQVRKKSVELSELFIAEVEAKCGNYDIELLSPRESTMRGSHVSFRAQQGYAILRALAAENVVSDFRAPNVMRFGFTPLYTRFSDVVIAVEKLYGILRERRWDRQEYKQVSGVT
jgi:kynureninase